MSLNLDCGKTQKVQETRLTNMYCVNTFIHWNVCIIWRKRSTQECRDRANMDCWWLHCIVSTGAQHTGRCCLTILKQW